MADLRTADQLLELAKNELGNMLMDSSTAAGDLSILVPAGSIREVLTKLRDADGLRFDLMSYMTVVDYHPQEPRFELVYDMYSVDTANRIRVRCRLADTGSEKDLPEIDSVADIFMASNWHEREAYDLYGINFKGHPDQRRILLPENWDGHPLRRDYPYDGKPVWKLGASVAEPEAKFDILEN
ncbi:MAG: NADH-quinone oxidoreductase subunit C [Planctomycetales bacterium]|nr:NADH-quinone oxidoreductase subunit C [bacterium]UNM08064.1 MAG: NADH-quinone oxidoreductase subunit C [Planctomycetales bacterium]